MLATDQLLGSGRCFAQITRGQSVPWASPSFGAGTEARHKCQLLNHSNAAPMAMFQSVGKRHDWGRVC